MLTFLTLVGPLKLNKFYGVVILEGFWSIVSNILDVFSVLGDRYVLIPFPIEIVG